MSSRAAASRRAPTKSGSRRAAGSRVHEARVPVPAVAAVLAAPQVLREAAEIARALAVRHVARDGVGRLLEAREAVGRAVMNSIMRAAPASSMRGPTSTSTSARAGAPRCADRDQRRDAAERRADQHRRRGEAPRDRRRRRRRTRSNA